MSLSILHYAIPACDKESAERIFKELFGLEQKKSFFLSPQLSYEIFQINEPIEAIVYGNEHCTFEVFLIKDVGTVSVHHICVEVESKEEFCKKCEKLDINIQFVQKAEKTLVFIRDDAGNLFEMKFRKS